LGCGLPTLAVSTLISGDSTVQNFAAASHLPGRRTWTWEETTLTIRPDTKDWTWVLRRPCPECGLDTQSFAREDVAGMTRVNAERWGQVLATGSDRGTRPAPGTWSPLEYGCHVRDVLRLYGTRLDLMLTIDGPRYPNWDQDATAVDDHYAEQDAAVVAIELEAAAAAIAARFDLVTGDQWQRTGFRSDGAQFTVETFARYFIHDPVHHLYDVTGIRAGG
jgi:hypothetical protein